VKDKKSENQEKVSLLSDMEEKKLAENVSPSIGYTSKACLSRCWLMSVVIVMWLVVAGVKSNIHFKNITERNGWAFPFFLIR